MAMNQQKQADMDKILRFIVDDLEEEGITYRERMFDIEGDESQYKDGILAAYDWDEEYLYKLVRSCITFGWIEHKELGDELSGLKLTEAGFNRVHPLGSINNERPNINLYNSHVINSIIGNNNTQNIQQIYNAGIQQIENMDISQDEKDEAKSLWSKFWNHPITGAVISGVVGGLTGNFLNK